MIQNIESASLDELRSELNLLFAPLKQGLEGVVLEDDFFSRSTGYVCDVYNRYKVLKQFEEEKIKKEKEEYEAASRKFLVGINALEVQPLYDTLKARLRPFIINDLVNKIITDYKSEIVAEKKTNAPSYIKRVSTIKALFGFLEQKNIKRYQNASNEIRLSNQAKEELVKTTSLITLYASRDKTYQDLFDNPVDVLYGLLMYKAGYGIKK